MAGAKALKNDLDILEGKKDNVMSEKESRR